MIEEDLEEDLVEKEEPITQDEAFRRAKLAASGGDPLGMITALYDSAFIDGMKQSLMRHWHQQIPEEEILDCIGQAVDKCYSYLRDGKSIHNLPAWLWKVAKNLVVDRWNDHYSHLYRGDSEAILNAAPASKVDDEFDDEDLRWQAILVARRLLPTLGQENIVRVMTYVLDAIEAD